MNIISLIFKVIPLVKLSVTVEHSHRKFARNQSISLWKKYENKIKIINL